MLALQALTRDIKKLWSVPWITVQRHTGDPNNFLPTRLLSGLEGLENPELN
ncbi:hypothetical protein PtA15_3A271 [Puccinia triticina]|uniref:Uncharacterized protein n=1 Tax=Puccinia triticina TaxID=208348 RepID=A0ABY7CCF9_9BASI|nr:uncharacterized protein PtA15_3A271 [Puccinia triticina]WAQ82906.1 hypothetical protein PtA15_3A271 [Puccinia triticina]WAR53733.1 hypothetical protein PtB15_3B242 [Puccinia triticina]